MGRVSSTAASTLGNGVSTQSIQNVDVVSNTEIQITLPAGSRRVYIKHRKSSKFEVRTTAGAAAFFTNIGGNVYTREGLAPTTTYSFFITPRFDGVLEIESWS